MSQADEQLFTNFIVHLIFSEKSKQVTDANWPELYIIDCSQHNLCQKLPGRFQGLFDNVSAAFQASPVLNIRQERRKL